jgi:hypothetical protein
MREVLSKENSSDDANEMNAIQASNGPYLDALVQNAWRLALSPAFGIVARLTEHEVLNRL